MVYPPVVPIHTVDGCSACHQRGVAGTPCQQRLQHGPHQQQACKDRGARQAACQTYFFTKWRVTAALKVQHRTLWCNLMIPLSMCNRVRFVLR